jgi:hypothetical protein
MQTTEMNSLANGSGVISSVGGSSGLFSSTQTQNYQFMDLSLKLPTMTAMTANNIISIWFVREVDGTNVENGTPPNRAPDAILVCTATTTAFLQAIGVPTPPESFKVYLLNNSGQSFVSSGCILTALPWTYTIPTQ